MSYCHGDDYRVCVSVVNQSVCVRVGNALLGCQIKEDALGLWRIYHLTASTQKPWHHFPFLQFKRAFLSLACFYIYYCSYTALETWLSCNSKVSKYNLFAHIWLSIAKHSIKIQVTFVCKIFLLTYISCWWYSVSVYCTFTFSVICFILPIELLIGRPLLKPTDTCW